MSLTDERASSLAATWSTRKVGGVRLAHSFLGWDYYQRLGGYAFALFNLLARLRRPVFLIKFGGKVAYGPRKNPLDFGSIPDHVTLGFGSG